MDRGDLRRAGDVGHEHPGANHVRKVEASLGQGLLDRPERRASLGAHVTRVAGSAVRPGVRGARDPARVADDDRPAVADGRFPGAARGDQATGAGGAGGRGSGIGAVAAHRDVRHEATTGSRPMASSNPASRAVRGTIEATSRYSSGE